MSLCGTNCRSGREHSESEVGRQVAAAHDMASPSLPKMAERGLRDALGGRARGHLDHKRPGNFLRAYMVLPALNGLAQCLHPPFADLGQMRRLSRQSLHLHMRSGKLGLIFSQRALSSRVVSRSRVLSARAVAVRYLLRPVIDIDSHCWSLTLNSPAIQVSAAG